MIRESAARPATIPTPTRSRSGRIRPQLPGVPQPERAAGGREQRAARQGMSRGAGEMRDLPHAKSETPGRTDPVRRSPDSDCPPRRCLPKLTGRTPSVTQANPLSCESGRAASKYGNHRPMPKKMQARAAASGAARQTAAAAPMDLKDPALYVNRELSLLAFQRRVLEEAEDEQQPAAGAREVPLHSRLQPGRVLHGARGRPGRPGGRRHRWRSGPDGMSPRAQLVAIRREVKRLLNEAPPLPGADCMPALDEQGIFVHDYAELSAAQRQQRGQAYFDETVFPVLTPLAFDPGPALSAHLEPEPEPGGADPRPRRPGALRARQGARFPAATGAGERGRAKANEQARPGPGGSTWSGWSR